MPDLGYDIRDLNVRSGKDPIGLKLKFYADGGDWCIAHLSSCHLVLDTFDIDRYNIIWLNVD
jgi:hypothetical protein